MGGLAPELAPDRVGIRCQFYLLDDSNGSHDSHCSLHVVGALVRWFVSKIVLQVVQVSRPRLLFGAGLGIILFIATLFGMLGTLQATSASVPINPSITIDGEGSVLQSRSGSNVTLTATAAVGWSFYEWTGPDSGVCNDATGVCVLDMSSAKSVTAVFAEDQGVVVTVSGGNGDVTDGAEGALACDETNPGTCTETYDYGDDITLTASADAGYRFTGWSGTDEEFCDDVAGTCTFTDISAAKAVTATFVAEWDVVVTVAGTGEGDVTDGAEGALACDETNDPCTESYDAGTNITLTATAATGSTFTGWSGAAAGDCTGSTCTFNTIAAAKAVTATFTDLIALYITYSGDGSGSVSDSVETYSDGEVTYWAAGSSVTLSQVSSDDFLGWRVATSGIPNPALCAIATSNCTLTINQDTLVDAEFDAASSGGGGGGGGGSSSPAPINTVSPELSGFTSPGASVVATSGTWEGASSYSFQWYRCTTASAVTQVTVPAGCVAITGADSATYLIQATDNGYWLRVRVRATGSGGATNIVSATSAKVGAKPESVKARPPRVMNGLASAGSTLAAKRGQWTNGPVTYAYQWYRCTKAGLKNPKSVPVACTAITGATAKTYTVKAADKGSYLRVRVTATGATGQGFRMSRTTGIIPN